MSGLFFWTLVLALVCGVAPLVVLGAGILFIAVCVIATAVTLVGMFVELCRFLRARGEGA